MAYMPTIGLEIHAELKTRTKMFCRSKNDADETRPNVNICPVCLAHPGTLPVINREAVRHVLRVGIALGGTLADYTEFDRKNYFYPDLPKGYQLSQYEFPLVSGGTLNGIAVTRVHLEEDTASSIHEGDSTLVDFNRASVPLMELVTEPVMRSAKEAADFGRELQLLLRALGASDADMEKGNMRLEANISVSDSEKLGTKVEIKNINSFRSMERAVEYEIKRQTKVLEKGGVVVQETRGWDDAKQATFPQRVKEGSADYRYFPDPDLPSLRLSEILELTEGVLKKGMPELPAARRARYVSLGVRAEDAASFVQDQVLGTFFEQVVSELGNDATLIRLGSNYVANDLVSLIRDSDKRETDLRAEIPISARNFATLVTMAATGEISSRSAKDILAELLSADLDPREIARTRGLFQVSDSGALDSSIETVIAENPSVVADYRSGKAAALEFLFGKVMKTLKGAADPHVLRKMLTERLRA